MEMSYLMVPIAFSFRRSTIGFNSLQDSGINWPRDFIGKKVRTVFTVDQTPRVTMAKESVCLAQYERVFLPSDIGQFASGDVPGGGRFIEELYGK
jgi:hypothetical protein